MKRFFNIFSSSLLGVIKDQLKDTPEWSNRRIADMLGVSPKTVIKYREDLEGIVEIPQCNNLETSDGRKYPAEKSKTIINPTNESRKTTEELCKKSGDEDVEQELDKISQGKETSSQAKKKIDKKEKKKELEKKKAEYNERIQTVESGSTDIFNTDKKYRVIFADPPWNYNDKQSTSQLGGATKHYHLMNIDSLSKLPIKDITKKDAVLFLWVTSPLLEESFDVIKG